MITICAKCQEEQKLTPYIIKATGTGVQFRQGLCARHYVMELASGMGSATTNLYHLTTHAFFKALLFLSAGVLIHAVHTQDIRQMGGLWRKVPVGAFAFLTGAVALCGIPPFSGFFSKDENKEINFKELTYGSL